MSENRSPDIAEEALRTGAVGCAVKSGGASELVNALRAVLEGTHFVSTHLTGHDPSDHMDQRSIDHGPGPQRMAAMNLQSQGHRSGHDVSLYPNDATLVDGLTRFVEAALKNGDEAVVLAAESHHADILPPLQRDGVDVPGAVESQRYISLDVADSLPELVAGGSRDGVRSASGEYSHLLDAVEAEAKKHIKVAVG